MLVNQSKSGLFSNAERLDMLTEVTAEFPNVRIAGFEGLLVDFCRARGRAVVVKGLRAVTDFDYELKMAQMNYGLSGLETLFMPTNPLYSFLSSSLIKDVAKWGGDISPHVPALVAERLAAKLAELQPAYGRDDRSLDRSDRPGRAGRVVGRSDGDRTAIAGR